MNKGIKALAYVGHTPNEDSAVEGTVIAGNATESSPAWICRPGEHIDGPIERVIAPDRESAAHVYARLWLNNEARDVYPVVVWDTGAVVMIEMTEHDIKSGDLE